MIDLQLINLISNKDGLLDDRWPLPQNLLWLGTYIEQFDYNVEILDTNIISLEDIKNKINAPLVGINFFATSAYLLEEVAKCAKDKGSIVVVGGQAATPLASQILCKNKYVDIVVLGDGEEALHELLKRVEMSSTSFEGISNIAYREGEQITIQDCKELDLKLLPIPDRRLKGIDIEQYISSYYETNTDGCTEEVRATNAYTKKGCPRRNKKRGCSFCARIDQSLRHKAPMQVYNEYKYLIEEFNINYIYDDSDSWVNRNWMHELKAIYKIHGDLNVKLRVYADVRDITLENVKIMKALGVDAVLVGIESGDETIRCMNGKNMSNEIILKAVDLLGSAEIKLCDAYVLGMIGESKKTIERTKQFEQQLNSYCEKQMTYWNIVLPLPGSKIWDKMMKVPELEKKYGSEYNFDLADVQKDFVRYFCNLGENGELYLNNICKHLQQVRAVPIRNYIR